MADIISVLQCLTRFSTRLCNMASRTWNHWLVAICKFATRGQRDVAWQFYWSLSYRRSIQGCTSQPTRLETVNQDSHAIRQLHQVPMVFDTFCYTSRYSSRWITYVYAGFPETDTKCQILMLLLLSFFLFGLAVNNVNTAQDLPLGHIV